jgi:hypothetical protein
MFWNTPIALVRPARGETVQRQYPRLTTESISCALGELLDLSRGGMRLACKGKPPLQIGQRAQIRLLFPRGSLLLTVQARWRRRRGLRSYEMGFAFIEPSPAAQATIESLAQFGFVPHLPRQEDTTESTRPVIRAAVELPDYYGTMGVDPGATQDEIRAAYRALVRRFHPDTATEPDAEARFKQVLRAYEVLSDIDQRATYDARLG